MVFPHSVTLRFFELWQYPACSRISPFSSIISFGAYPRQLKRLR
jgi:hypothetical protein